MKNRSQLVLVIALFFSLKGFASSVNYQVIQSDDFKSTATEQLTCFWQTFDGRLFINEINLNCSPDGIYCDSIQFGNLQMSPTLNVDKDSGYLRVNITDSENNMTVFAMSYMGENSTLNAMVSYVKSISTNGYQASCEFTPPPDPTTN